MDHSVKVQDNEENFVLVNTDSAPKLASIKEKEVRVVMEQIQLEDDEEDDDNETPEVEGDTDDLLVSLPDDTEVGGILASQVSDSKSDLGH